MKNSKIVNIIGCGFAGIECALFLASQGKRVHIFDLEQDCYQCDCHNCEQIDKNNKNQIYARGLLREELKILGSSLVEQESKLSKNGLIECGCVASRLLEYGKKLIKENPNIEYFKASIKELDIDEINVVATGPRTDKDFFEWLKEQFGSMRCYDNFYDNPVVSGVDASLLYKKEGDNSDDLYFPFDYQSYIDFCNVIIKARNDYLDLSGNKQITSGELSIEKLVENGKDSLKNQVLRPCKLEGYNDRPYAVLRLKKHNQGYELCGLSSDLPYILQDFIFSSLQPLKKCKLEKKGRILQNRYLNSPFVINYFSQSNKNDKLFFAGAITGLEGHLEAMASGLMVGYNILSLIFGKKIKPIPSCTCIGSMMKKIILINTLKFSPIVANYDIIEGSERFDSLDSLKNNQLAISRGELTKYMEDFNGK